MKEESCKQHKPAINLCLYTLHSQNSSSTGLFQVHRISIKIHSAPEQVAIAVKGLTFIQKYIL